MFALCCLTLISVAAAQLVPLPGGLTQVPASQLGRSDLVDVSNFVANYYTKELNGHYTNGDNIQLIAASTQVVSGTNYYLSYKLTTGHNIHYCDIVVYDQSWTNTRMVTKDSCAVNHHNTRQTGGSHTAVLSDEAKGAAAWAADNINMMTNSMYVSCLVDTSNVKQQVVAGIMFTMDIVLKDSTIRKGTDVSATNGCTAPVMSNTRSCHVKVWDEPWRTPRYILQEHHCVQLAS